MKKLLIALVLILLLIIAGIYILIPKKLLVSRVVAFPCTTNAAFRFASDETKIAKWWPSSQQNSSNSLTYKGDSFQIADKFHQIVNINIRGADFQCASSMSILALPGDSVAVNWQADFASDLNPIDRIKSYKLAQRVGDHLKDLLISYANFMSKPANIYVYPLTISSIRDTLLIANKFIDTVYPSTATIYKVIHDLKAYAQKQGAEVNGSPMLNVTKLETKQFQTMIALPLNKEIPANKQFFNRRMVPGRFVITEVMGGQSTIQAAMQELQYYFDDNRKISMAIPFQYLITDRSNEKDSSKWVTRIYAPVM